MHFNLSVPLSTKTVHIGFDSHYQPQEPISPYVLKEAAKFAFGAMVVHVQNTFAFNQEQVLNSYREMSRPEWQTAICENHGASITVGFELNHVGTQLTLRAVEIERRISQNLQASVDLDLIKLEVERDDLTLQYKQVADRLHNHTALEILAERSRDLANNLFVDFKE